MSHQLDFNGILEKLILLEHFSFGSKGYCKLRLVGSDKDIGDQEFDDYWGWVKSIVSNYTIECAIKFRILQDTIRGKKDIIKLENLDSKACDGVSIGKVLNGSFKISLRETSNKIIHAKSVIPQWATTEDAQNIGMDL